MNLPSWLQSSQDPTKVSLTITAIIAGIIPFLAIINKVFGTHLVDTELQSISDALTSTVMAVWAACSAVAFLYGLVRKTFKK